MTLTMQIVTYYHQITEEFGKIKLQAIHGKM